MNNEDQEYLAYQEAKKVNISLERLEEMTTNELLIAKEYAIENSHGVNCRNIDSILKTRRMLNKSINMSTFVDENTLETSVQIHFLNGLELKEELMVDNLPELQQYLNFNFVKVENNAKPEALSIELSSSNGCNEAKLYFYNKGVLVLSMVVLDIPGFSGKYN